MAKKTYIKAITEGIDIALSEDPKTLVFGEDVGKNGGVFRTTNGLQEKYGKDRVFSTPLAESGILGLSIGLAATGWRPVPEIQFMGFTFEAMDSIAGQMSRVRFQYDGTKNMPITIRTPYGGGTHTAELHGDDLVNFFVGIPGLRVVTPSQLMTLRDLLFPLLKIMTQFSSLKTFVSTVQLRAKFLMTSTLFLWTRQMSLKKVTM